nr:hydrogenase maturation nickel metallochaperone HypA [Solimonas flava]
MHEVSLAGGVIRLVEDALAREPRVRVKRVVLAVGALAGVEVRALRFALDALAPGSVLAGAAIEIDEVAGRAWCLNCAANVAIHSRLDDCPQCGGRWLQPNGGTELSVRELIVEDLPDAPDASAHQEPASCASSAAVISVH